MLLPSQAVRLASTEARDLVPRLLQLLMVEPKGAEVLSRVVAQKAADLPGWVWLPWVPQLMTSLQRPEVAVARRILSAAAGAFPQQLYWHVRPGMLAMKDAAVKAVQDAKAQVCRCLPPCCHPRPVHASAPWFEHSDRMCPAGQRAIGSSCSAGWRIGRASSPWRASWCHCQG